MIERIEWNSKLPNPFLRGKDERPLRITFHSQSLNNLSVEEKSAVELLRELTNLPELEAFGTNPGDFPHIVVREPSPKDDFIPVELVQRDTLLARTLVWNKNQWPAIAKGLLGLNQHNEEIIQTAINVLVLAQAHRSVKGDILVTKSSFLLENRDKSFVRETNPFTPIEASKIVGLFLRSRDNYTYRAERKIKMSFNRGSFYWVLARYRLPQMWKYFSACVAAGKTHNDDLQGLGESVLIRSVRALEALDAIGIQFYLPQNHETSDQTMYHFDYLTLVLSGALDAQARVANKVYRIKKKVTDIGFQKGSFTKALRSEGAQGLCDFVNNQKFKDLKNPKGRVPRACAWVNVCDGDMR